MTAEFDCTARMHNTEHARYRLGCVCVGGKEAAVRRLKLRAAGLLPNKIIDGTGTRRRIQALVAMGYSFGDLGESMGFTHDWATRLSRADRVNRDTAEAVNKLYGLLWMTPPAPSRKASYARGVAARNGWVTGMAWDDIDDPNGKPSLGAKYQKRGDEVDLVCVAQALDGQRSFQGLTKAEGRLVVRRLVEQRFWSDARIAEWLHTTDRTVLRTRQAAGIKAVPMTRQLDAA